MERSKDYENLKYTPVGYTFRHSLGTLLVKRTSKTFNCEICSLFYGTATHGCSCDVGRHNKVCFANERPDKESVYFKLVSPCAAPRR